MDYSVVRIYLYRAWIWSRDRARQRRRARVTCLAASDATRDRARSRARAPVVELVHARELDVLRVHVHLVDGRLRARGSRPRALARPDAAERRASSSPRRWRGRHDGGGRSPRETSRQRSSSSRRTRARGRRRAARSRPRARRSRDRRARRARARWRSIRGPRIHRSSSPRGSLSSRRRRGTRARTPTSRPRAFSFPFRVFPRTPGAFRVRGVSGVARARVCTRGARRCVRARGDDAR